VTNANRNGILESTQKQFHHRWFATCVTLVFGLAILLALNSISTYRWVSRPIVPEQPRSGTMHSPIAIRTAVFSAMTHKHAEWSLRRALMINLLASLALLLSLGLIALRFGPHNRL
jgi:hypothetical protein